MSRKNVTQAVEAFLEGRAYGEASKAATIWTDGEAIYSYAMPIAQRRNGAVLVLDRWLGPTATTKSHIAEVIHQIDYCKVVDRLPDEQRLSRLGVSAYAAKVRA